MEKLYVLEHFQNHLSNRYAEEKKLIKTIQLLGDRAGSPELRKALSPVETGSDVHLDRLDQLLKRMKLKKGNTVAETADALVKEAKSAAGRKNVVSLEKDFNILICAKRIQHERIVHFQLLHLMSVALNLEFEASLLEQCLAEHQNTDAYLSQIAQNVLLKVAE